MVNNIRYQIQVLLTNSEIVDFVELPFLGVLLCLSMNLV